METYTRNDEAIKSIIDEAYNALPYTSSYRAAFYDQSAEEFFYNNETGETLTEQCDGDENAANHVAAVFEQHIEALKEENETEMA